MEGEVGEREMQDEGREQMREERADECRAKGREQMMLYKKSQTCVGK